MFITSPVFAGVPALALLPLLAAGVFDITGFAAFEPARAGAVALLPELPALALLGAFGSLTPMVMVGVLGVRP